MCDRLVLDGEAYICSDCYDELLSFKDKWPNQMSPLEIENRIRLFMRTKPKSTIVLDSKEIDKEFRRLTGG
jgi:hypothetical protein